MAIAVTTTPSQIRPLVTSPQRSSTPSHPQPEPWLICIWLWQKSPFCAKPFLKSLFAPVGHGRFSTSQVFCAKIPTVKFAPMGALNSKFCIHNGARSFPHHEPPSRSVDGLCCLVWCLLLSLCGLSTNSLLSFNAICVVFLSRFCVFLCLPLRQSAPLVRTLHQCALSVLKQIHVLLTLCGANDSNLNWQRSFKSVDLKHILVCIKGQI